MRTHHASIRNNRRTVATPSRRRAGILSRLAVAAVAASSFAAGAGVAAAPANAATITQATRASWAVSFARAQIGKPYIWGGTGPSGYDCSGLTQTSWRHAGVSIARLAASQYWSGPRVPLSRAKPGDLVFWSSSRYPSGIYHVGLYVGNDRMVDAPHTGAKVRVDVLWPGAYGYATQP